MVLADMLTLAYVLKQKYQQSSRQDGKATKGQSLARYCCPDTVSCSELARLSSYRDSACARSFVSRILK